MYDCRAVYHAVTANETQRDWCNNDHK